MPQPALHVMLATAVLEHWKTSPQYAPFSCNDQLSAHAFLHGSLAPDMGLFPGGNARFSEITHYGQTADVLRSLLRHARTDAQRAFAWGWLTHVLADVAIHPLVNRAAAELAGGTSTLADHVRVEVGLDAQFAWQHTVLSQFRLQRMFEPGDVHFLRDALLETHGYSVTPNDLLRMHTAVVHFGNLALRFATAHARTLCWDASNAAGYAWRGAIALAPRESLVRAYLLPEMPQPWLVENVRDVIVGFIDTVDAYAGTGVHMLPNYNLETGETEFAARLVA